MLAPAGTPATVIERLHKEITAIQNSPDVQKQFEAEGAEVVHMSPAELGSFLAKETSKWERVVKTANIKAE